MRPLAPRPILLALTLVLVVGAIALIELRLEGGGATTAALRQPDRQAAEEQPKADRQPVARTTQEGVAGGKKQPVSDAERIASKQARYPRAREIVAPSGFINTQEVSIKQAAGEKVVLLEFWTYSCFNCQNVQPHLNAWHAEYSDEGLQVVGVHTPEFAFERDYEGVEAAVQEAGISYPVVLDNAYATWDAYDNRYWPAIYLIDADGFIRYRHFGEGAYDQTEAKIREFLAERDRISS